MLQVELLTHCFHAQTNFPSSAKAHKKRLLKTDGKDVVHHRHQRKK